MIVIFQIGAIFLWSFVYNIIRISSIRSTKEVNRFTLVTGSPHETCKLLEDGCSEAVASAEDCSNPGQAADQCAVSTGSEEIVLKEKEKVYFLFSVCYSIVRFRCSSIHFKLVITLLVGMKLYTWLQKFF